MEEKMLKLVSYLGLIAVIVYAVASALGKRDQLQKKPLPCSRRQRAMGAVWANRNVPLPTVLQPAGVAPQVLR